MIEKFLINRTWLIEYNQVGLHVRMMGIRELMNNTKEINIQV